MTVLKPGTPAFLMAAALAFALAASGCGTTENDPGSMKKEASLNGTACFTCAIAMEIPG